MTFTRTSSGISNQHLFYGVDLIVFVEGGKKSFTKEDVDNNSGSDYSIDIFFWNKLFDLYSSKKKIKFRAVGSKLTLLKIAKEIVEKGIQTSCVAMDKEFDEIIGTLIKNNNVLYTYGYSWENDAWNESLIRSIVNTLSPLPCEDSMIDAPYRKFLKDVEICVFADCYQFSKGISLLSKHMGHMQYIECNINKCPHLKKDKINMLLTSQGLNERSLLDYGLEKSLDPKTHCYGHLFGDFCRHIIHHILKKLTMGTISKKMIEGLVINKFIEHLTPDLKRYYCKILKTL